jgi:hypothetical protein
MPPSNHFLRRVGRILRYHPGTYRPCPFRGRWLERRLWERLTSRESNQRRLIRTSRAKMRWRTGLRLARAHTLPKLTANL